jgi:hypothetical protein
MTTLPRRRNGQPPVAAHNGHAPVTAQPVPTSHASSARRWQRQYSRRLRITDSLIVCASVMLAQHVRFGDSPYTSGYPGQLMTLFSFLFAAVWLSSIAVFTLDRSASSVPVSRNIGASPAHHSGLSESSR